MSRHALMLGLLLASGASAEELTPRTRALLHEALETRLALPTDPPSLQRPLLLPGLPASPQLRTRATRRTPMQRPRIERRRTRPTARAMGTTRATRLATPPVRPVEWSRARAAGTAGTTGTATGTETAVATAGATEIPTAAPPVRPSTEHGRAAPLRRSAGVPLVRGTEPQRAAPPRRSSRVPRR